MSPKPYDNFVTSLLLYYEDFCNVIIWRIWRKKYEEKNTKMQII